MQRERKCFPRATWPDHPCRYEAPDCAAFSNPLLFLVLTFSSASSCQIPSAFIHSHDGPRFLAKLILYCGTWDTTVGVVKASRTERPTNRGLILRRGNRFFFSTKLSDRMMVPPSLLLIAYRRPFPWE